MKWSIETEVVIRSLRSEFTAEDTHFSSQDQAWIAASIPNNYWVNLLNCQLIANAADKDIAMPLGPKSPRRPAPSRSVRESILAEEV